jgi:hypothetical protein
MAGVVVLVLALLVVTTAAVAEEAWVTAANGQLVAVPGATAQVPQMNVTAYGPDGLTVLVDVAGLEFGQTKNAAGQFTTLTCPRTPLGGEAGQPGVPVVRQLFFGPADGIVNVTVDAGPAVTSNLAALGYSSPLWPVQASVRMDENMPEVLLVDWDAAAYGQDELGPAERVTVTELGIVRGHYLYLLEVRPVAYNPVTGDLAFWPQIGVGLDFPGGCAEGLPLGPMAGVNHSVLNPLPPEPMGRGEGNYLILTPSLYYDTTALNALTAWRTAQGFDVTTHLVASGTSRTTLKSYIQGLWGTANAPDYVLLVGDTTGSSSSTNSLPHWSGAVNSATTDLPYACMDAGDDWYPDIAVGRLSVDTKEQLDDVVEKILFVEAGEYSDPDYVKRVAMAATNDMSSGGEESHEAVIADILTPAEYVPTRIYARLGGGTADITAAVEAGSAFTLYFGHSDSGGWWNPGFEQGDINGLENAGLYGLTFGFSCNTAHFNYDECSGEIWLRKQDAGSAAYLSASTYIYYTQSPWHESQFLEYHFFESFLVEDIWEVRPAWDAALYDMLGHYGATNTTRDHFEMFVLLGDPAFRVPQERGFSLHPAPETQSLCCPPKVEANYTIEVQQHQDFSETVTLSADNLPPGTTADFSVNSQPPPFTTVMTISNIAPAAPGSYMIDIIGTATSLEISKTVGLNLSTGLPDTVVLTSPNDGAINVARKPTLVWQPAAQAAEYDIQVSLNGAFTAIVYTATTTDTQHMLENNLASDTLHYWRVRAANGCGDGSWSTPFSFRTIAIPDYFTEQFNGNFDLDNFCILFHPDGSGSHYRACGGEQTEFFVDPSTATTLSLADDGSQHIYLGDSRAVELYGLGYSSFYVNANGSITFSSGDGEYEETLPGHFGQPRIAPLFDDLNPETGGRISWQQLDDRAVVTYENLPEWSSSNLNSFQVEMFFDGDLRVTWLRIDSNDSIVGLSGGDGLPGDYDASDLSATGPCYFVGDMNCDGAIDNFDIGPFVMALTNPTGYQDAYPNCDINLADCNGDGAVDNFDISAFVGLLTGP